MHEQQPWMITPAQLNQIQKSVVIVDVREREEWDQDGRIDGAKLIPLGELDGRAGNELGKKDDIVLYCAHGVRSMHALMALRMMGFEKLRSLEGGIEGWKEAGFPA
ncbi:MAG: rhodanese-like domain-containing protein [Bdellovibrionota bacterium]